MNCHSTVITNFLEWPLARRLTMNDKNGSYQNCVKIPQKHSIANNLYRVLNDQISSLKLFLDRLHVCPETGIQLLKTYQKFSFCLTYWLLNTILTLRPYHVTTALFLLDEYHKKNNQVKLTWSFYQNSRKSIDGKQSLIFSTKTSKWFRKNFFLCKSVVEWDNVRNSRNYRVCYFIVPKSFLEFSIKKIILNHVPMNQFERYVTYYFFPRTRFGYKFSDWYKMEFLRNDIFCLLISWNGKKTHSDN